MRIVADGDARAGKTDILALRLSVIDGLRGQILSATGVVDVGDRKNTRCVCLGILNGGITKAAGLTEQCPARYFRIYSLAAKECQQ